MDEQFKIIVKLAIDCIDSFNPVTSSVDTHFEDYVNSKKIKDKSHINFIKSLLYGIYRYDKILKVFFKFRLFLKVYKKIIMLRPKIKSFMTFFPLFYFLNLMIFLWKNLK